MPLPKLAWDFNGTTADYVQGLTGTTVGSATYNSSGKYGQSLIMNGSSYITYNYPAPITLSTTGATISMWLKTLTLPPSTVSHWLFASYGSATNNRIYAFYYSDGSVWFYFIDNLGGYIGTSTYLNNPPLGAWSHYAFVLGADNVALYKNGVLMGSYAAKMAGITLDTRFTIAALSGGGGGNINAEYDDLRIFDRALTSAQVQSIYNQQGVPGRGALVPQSPQPSLMWQFESSNVDSVTGLVPSSSIGTLGYTPGKYGQAAFFNQTPGTTPTLSLTYTLPSGITANNCTISFWLKPYFAIPSSSGNQQFVSFVDSQVIYYMGFNSQASTTQPSLYYYNGANNTLSGGNPATQVWYHTVGVLSNVGQTGQNSNWTYYFNGVSVGSFVVNKTGTSPISSLYVGSAGGTGSSSYMAIDDLRVFNTALTAAQVQAIYGTSGMPSRQVLSGTPLFTQLSPSARSSAVGAFSLRAVNGTSARAVQVRAQGQFPSTGFTSAVTNPGGNQYNQTLTGYAFGGTGVYTSNCSSWAFYDGNIPGPWKAFDYNTGTWWENNYGADPGYNAIGATSANTYSGSYTTTVSGSSIGGEWVQLGLPTAIVLYSYSMYNRSGFTGYRMPYAWTIAGSNDGTTWATVDSQTGIIWTSSTQTFTTTSTTPYLYFRLIVRAIQSNGNAGQPVNIGQWTLNGSNSSWNTDFYADRLGNLLTAPVVGQSLANWLGGATGYVTKWYDQSGLGNHMAQATASNQPTMNLSTKPASLILTGTEYFQNTVPFTFNFGSGSFTLRYVVSNNTGGLVVYKADSADFTWTPYEKKFWLGNGTTTESSRGGYPSQVGNSEDYVLGAAAIGSSKTSVVHKATAVNTSVPIYVNGTIQSLSRNNINMKTDPGNFLYFGRGGNASNYIGNLHEIQIFSTALSDSDRLALENGT
jgi:hypothetical protein